jgi:hypothetical protein
MIQNALPSSNAAGLHFFCWSQYIPKPNILYLIDAFLEERMHKIIQQVILSKTAIIDINIIYRLYRKPVRWIVGLTNCIKKDLRQKSFLQFHTKSSELICRWKYRLYKIENPLL